MKPRITPKLVVEGADRALAFYAQVLGGEVTQRFDLGDRVVFAQVEVGGTAVQVKDADDTDPAPAAGVPGSIVDLACDDPDAVMARALERGAEEVFPVADQPYGARQGRFRDPFGHQWIVGAPLTLTDEEVQASLDAMGPE